MGVFILLLILIISMVQDLKLKKVKNWLILIGLLLGLFSRVWLLGARGLGLFFLGTSIPIALLFLLFLFRVMGAGDIKLLSVVGGFLGPSSVLQCIILTFLIGAIFALIKVIRKQNLVYRLQNLAKYLSKFMKTKKIEAYYTLEDGTDCIIPFTVPIFLSVIINLGGGIY